MHVEERSAEGKKIERRQNVVRGGAAENSFGGTGKLPKTNQ